MPCFETARLLFLASLGACLVLPVGCDSTPGTATPDAGPPEIALACAPDRPCRDGLMCVRGFCIAPCADDVQCGPLERCASSGPNAGLCVVRENVTTTDPCLFVVCAGAKPVCHPASGECVACTLGEHCPSDRPVCDRARGECVVSSGGLCAPCNGDGDCFGAGSGTIGCVALDEPYERVCAASCRNERDCAPSFECSPGLGLCLPKVGSCTGYDAAERGASCIDVRDCSGLGIEESSPFAGQCYEGRCARGCTATPDCPGALVCAPPVCRP